MSTALFLLIGKEHAAELPGLVAISLGGRRRLHKGPRRRILRHHGHRHPAGLISVLVHYAGAKWIDIIMPPVVNGAIVAIIGFNLAPSVEQLQSRSRHRRIVTLVAVLLVAVLFKVCSADSNASSSA